MSEEAKKLMREFAKLYKAELKYSTICDKFYIASNIEVSDGIVKTSLCLHKDTPEEAIFGFNEKLISLSL